MLSFLSWPNPMATYKTHQSCHQPTSIALVSASDHGSLPSLPTTSVSGPWLSFPQRSHPTCMLHACVTPILWPCLPHTATVVSCPRLSSCSTPSSLPKLPPTSQDAPAPAFSTNEVDNARKGPLCGPTANLREGPSFLLYKKADKNL